MKHLLAFTLLTTAALSAEDGKANYTLYCSACHAPDGKGINNGQFPPLAGSEWVKGDANRMIQAVLHGLQGPIHAAGKDYNLVMPPQGSALTDPQIASIITYVRSSWGHKESAVTTDQIKKARVDSKDRDKMWESTELLTKYPIPDYKGATSQPGKAGKIHDLLSYIHHGDFGSLKELRATKAKNAEEEKQGLISLKHADRKEKFGLVWEGWLDVPQNGKYTFIFDTDDGGALTLNGKEVITRDRIGPVGKPTKKAVKLKKGRNEIKIEYFEKNGQEAISLVWDGPGVSNQRLSETAGKQKAATPSIPLTPPINEATIYRNFIAGTDARGIGVGYFENVNLAFSADSMSVDMLWTGKFMDAGRHWTGRGQGFEPPAGNQLVTINRGLPFAILESQTTAWPAGPDASLQPRFRGYKLDKKQQPTFQYEFGNVKISDLTLPANTGQGFSRTLTLDVPEGSASDKVLYFRALSGNEVNATGERSFDFDKLTVNVTASEYAPFPREKELLIPVPLNAGSHRIQINYIWK